MSILDPPAESPRELGTRTLAPGNERVRDRALTLLAPVLSGQDEVLLDDTRRPVRPAADASGLIVVRPETGS